MKAQFIIISVLDYSGIAIEKDKSDDIKSLCRSRISKPFMSVESELSSID